MKVLSMKLNSYTTLGLVSIFTAGGASFVDAQSAWLPQEKEFSVTPLYIFQKFDEFWMGTKKTNPGWDSSIKQHTVSLAVEYGITKKLAADLTFGYTRSEAKFAGETLDGMTDTTVGLRYQLLDEKDAGCAYAPTVAWRVGGILAGSYPISAVAPHSPGDGAAGFETSLLFGKAIGDTGFGLFGDVGYRNRAEGVPDDFFFSAGVYKQLFQAWTLSFGYRQVQGLSGRDIAGPGWANQWPELRENKKSLEAGIGYTDKGNRHYQLFGATVIDGRNTGESIVMGASITLTF